MKLLGIVAGETSGDRLGAGLIEALRVRYPQLQVSGIGGPQMAAAGAEIMYPTERLAVMGIGEIIRRYRELHGIRNAVAEHFIKNPPDAFVAIDAPDFNLGLEARLHAAGIRTVHYVSPQFWAWRRWRLKQIPKIVDLMLTLFPFEDRYYHEHGVPVRCVGHPLAEELNRHPVDRHAARTRLNVPHDRPVLALLPGSRANEWHYHVEPFLQSAAWLAARKPDLHCLVAASNEPAAEHIRTVQEQLRMPFSTQVPVGQVRDVLAAADVVLTVSGTATLETLLCNRPMVVAYRLGSFSYWVARALVRVPFIALPNLLAGERIVPEFIQADVIPESLGAALLNWFTDAHAVERLRQQCDAIRSSLCLGGHQAAALAVAELCER